MEMDESLRPPGPDQESAVWFREQLEVLGWTKGDLIRFLLSYGDDRQPKTIDRSLKRIAAGEARVSGELRVLLTMLRTVHWTDNKRPTYPIEAHETAYREGREACEAGRAPGDNPYWKTGGTPAIQWRRGFRARQEEGFDVSNLPRKPSGGFR